MDRPRQPHVVRTWTVDRIRQKPPVMSHPAVAPPRNLAKPTPPPKKPKV